jgi:hypothetical protein
MLCIGFVGVLLMTTSARVRAALDDSVVLYLPFDEGSGDKVADVSKAAHPTEVINKPSWTDGKLNKALEFDGTKQQYVKVPLTDDLQLVDKFSVAFWVKRSDKQISDWNYMVAGGTLRWAVIFNRNQNVYVWSQTGGAWAQKAVTTKALSTSWTHIAMTHDTSDGVRIYFDAEVAGEGGKPPKVDPLDGSIMVGARNPGQEFFTGTIDEVALFKRIISLDDIKTHRDGGMLGVESKGKLAFTWGALKRSR